MQEDPSDSEDETLGEIYGNDEDDAEAEIEVDEDTNPAMTPGDGGDDATEDGDDDSDSDTSDSDDTEEEEEEEEEPLLDLGLTEEVDPEPVPPPLSERASTKASKSPTPPAPSSPKVKLITPAQLRRSGLAFNLANAPRSYIVEAICAIPHPVPTHALASSACITHLLTGSDDGYIRDYDVFAAVNGKTFLSAPQRHHAGVVEGLMKAGQLRFWWENPSLQEPKTAGTGIEEESSLAPVYSLAMHSDALWALAGTDAGYINLFTVRHDPGRLIHVLNGHRGPVSALALDYDEKGFLSAGWDGEAIQWDLNTGQKARSYIAHNTQLTSIALRPQYSGYAHAGPGIYSQSSQGTQLNSQPEMMNVDSDVKPLIQDQLTDNSLMTIDSDARSDASFDPLFDDVPEESSTQRAVESKPVVPANTQPQPSARAPPSAIPPPKGAPPLFDPVEYSTYSSDVLMTAFIDGQVILWDKRVNSPGSGVGRLWMSEKTPPWCLSACWSADGAQIYAGRRNGTVDCWDVRVLGQSGPANTPRLFRTLRNPTSSGVVSCVAAFPDCRHIACASVDNIRLWNVADEEARSKSGVQFKIIPGHHGGYISQMLIDPGSRFLVSASSNRGWHGESTRTVFVHDIKRVN
ncbi:WD40-repeat-containing domain protein [Crepidotus variabilis]|uniref:WD40-repeat-containing domain protein n=1 Tax=Crepidotus variabilis TaxID=179855 RepID=A0A9P6EUI3_9AGAR|nr:WD40-repeat-containing domain protein [Crepidotus variabilis]